MRRSAKAWWITSAVLILFGLILFAIAMTANEWDFTKLGTEVYEDNAFEIREDFRNIDIKSDTADIQFLSAEDSVCKVICHESEKQKHAVSVQDHALTITLTDNREWYEYIGIQTEKMKITVYLPKESYGTLTINEHTGDIEIPVGFFFENIDVVTTTGDVKNEASASERIRVHTSTGDILVQNITADTLDLAVSTGKIEATTLTVASDARIRVTTGKTRISDMICETLVSHGSTGDISLQNVIASDRFSIERSTGDVSFDGCDAAALFVKTDTGDVKGTLLSEKRFFAESDTGKILVPKHTDGGKCEITTDTGDIKVEISP